MENLTNVSVIWRVDVNEVIKEVDDDDVPKLHGDDDVLHTDSVSVFK